MLTAKQIEFCKQVANGKNATEAYQIAFKTKNRATCKVNGSKLLKEPEIKAKISESKALAREIVKESQKNAIASVTLKEVMDVNERMATLTQIARGQTKIRRDKFFFDSKAGEVISQEVEELPNCAERIKAINELNEMDGSHSPEKIEHAVSAKLPTWLQKT